MSAKPLQFHVRARCILRPLAGSPLRSSPWRLCCCQWELSQLQEALVAPLSAHLVEPWLRTGEARPSAAPESLSRCRRRSETSDDGRRSPPLAFGDPGTRTPRAEADPAISCPCGGARGDPKLNAPRGRLSPNFYAPVSLLRLSLLRFVDSTFLDAATCRNPRRPSTPATSKPGQRAVNP